MIDGESSKAEKVLIWRYDCSYSDAYLIKTSPDLTPKRFYNYTKRAFTGVNESNPSETEDMEKFDHDDHLETYQIQYSKLYRVNSNNIQ